MTALTQDRSPESKPGVDQGFPMAADTVIFLGALVALAAGYAAPGADTAGLRFIGWATGPVDNSGGADGDAQVVVRRKGLFRVNCGTTLSQSDVGSGAYLVDDQTVDLVGNVSNAVLAGVIVEVLAGGDQVFIDIEPAINGV